MVSQHVIMATQTTNRASHHVARMPDSIIHVQFSAVFGDIKKSYGLPSFSVKISMTLIVSDDLLVTLISQGHELCCSKQNQYICICISNIIPV